MSGCDIYVVNLPGSSERRKNIVSQLEALQVPFRIFEAVDGKGQSAIMFDKYNANKRMRLKGKPLVRGQLGCYASHYLLWEKCVSRNKPIIVLEDDARLFPEFFLMFYQSVNDLDSGYECIRLFESYGKKRKGIRVGACAGLEFFKYTKGYMGTIGYYLTPTAAEKFLQDSEEWFLTVDLFMDRFWSNKVEYYGVLPACLDFDPNFASEIDYAQQREKRSLWTKVQRELFSISEAVRRMFWNFRFICKRFWCALIARKG